MRQSVILGLSSENQGFAEVACDEILRRLSAMGSVEVAEAPNVSNGRRTRLGALEFTLAVLSTPVVLEVAKVVRDVLVNRRVSISLKRTDGMTLKMEAQGGRIPDVKEIASFLETGEGGYRYMD